MAATVVVYCKIPNGYHLTVKDTAGVDHTIRINGPANKVSEPLRHVVLAGHGATTVPKDHWDAWLETHQNLDPVKRGHIFAAEKPQVGKDMARERKDNRTGLEPIDPKKPGKGIKPDDSMQKVLDQIPDEA